MSLKFYYAPMSSAITIHWALEELKIPYEGVKLSFSKEGTLSFENASITRDEYLKLNPNCKVPLIVHDGHPVFESIAILMYLGETFGVEKGLYPKPGFDRANAMQWMLWCQASVGSEINRMLLNSSERIPADLRNANAAAAAKKDLDRLLGILDQHLKGRDYVATSYFALPDVLFGSMLGWMQMLQVDMSKYENIKSYMGRVTDRPGFHKSMQP